MIYRLYDFLKKGLPEKGKPNLILDLFRAYFLFIEQIRVNVAMDYMEN